MLSINIYLRFALMAVLLIGGTVLAFLFGFWYAFPLLLAGIALLVGYVMLGTVQSAAQIMNATDFEGAEKRLNLTLTPKLLYPTNRAYYYMLKGSIALANRQTDESEQWLRKAQEVKIPTDNEKAMLEIQLGNIMASKGKWQQAKNHLRAAKQMKVSEPQIKEQIKQFEKTLQQQSQMRSAARGQQGQTMRPGGKRRRPKIR